MLQFLVESPWEKKLYRVDAERIRIGRSRAAEIPLLDEGAKKRCAEIHRDAARITVRDLTGDGLVLNGRAAGRDGTLTVGDRIGVAATTITLQAVLSRRPEAADESPAPTPTPAPAEAPGEEPGGRSVRLDPAADSGFLAGGLRSVLEINKRLVRESDGKVLLGLVLDAAIDLTGAERGFLLLVAEGKLEARVARNLEGDPVENPELEVSRSIAREAMKTGKAVLAEDAGRDERWSGHQSVAALSLRSVLSVPLVADDEVLGALYVDDRVERGAFTESHVRLLEAFADQAALAIRSSRLAEGLRRRGEELEAKNREVERLNARLAGELSRAREDLESRQGELEFKYDYRQIIGRSKGIRQVLKTLDKVTDLNVPVFIEGESGTGKELVARALHFNGPRRRGRFVTENCSAIPDTLVEKILFGHVRGAFTGADRDAPGLFEQADGGTLFLDEIGDMTPDAQKKILRVLQEGEIRRVGGKDVRKVDARIVCATNRDVDELRESGEFREDLYWRLVVVRIRIPPLRERAEDVPLLVDHFLDRFSKEMGIPRKPVQAGALDTLCRYPWPGNVRELMNEIRRVVALAEESIGVEALSERIRNAPPSPPVTWTENRTMRDVVEEVERAMIERELERTGGNKTKAADALGLSRLGLRNKMQRYGVE